MELGQDGPISDVNPGERVREVMGDGPLDDGLDVGQGMGDLSVPDDPGPALAGRTPIIGTVRRSRGMTVVRDMVALQMG